MWPLSWVCMALLLPNAYENAYVCMPIISDCAHVHAHAHAEHRHNARKRRPILDVDFLLGMWPIRSRRGGNTSYVDVYHLCWLCSTLFKTKQIEKIVRLVSSHQLCSPLLR